MGLRRLRPVLKCRKRSQRFQVGEHSDARALEQLPAAKGEGCGELQTGAAARSLVEQRQAMAPVGGVERKSTELVRGVVGEPQPLPAQRYPERAAEADPTVQVPGIRGVASASPSSDAAPSSSSYARREAGTPATWAVGSPRRWRPAVTPCSAAEGSDAKV